MYDLANIEVPVHMIVGSEDKLSSLEDTKKLNDALVNSKNKTFSIYKIGHATFTWGINMDFMNEVFQLLETKDY